MADRVDVLFGRVTLDDYQRGKALAALVAATIVMTPLMRTCLCADSMYANIDFESALVPSFPQPIDHYQPRIPPEPVADAGIDVFALKAL